MMMILKNISSVITVVIFTYNGMLRFSIFVSGDSQKSILVPRNMGSTHVAFLILVFHSHFFAFGGTHTALNSLTLHEPASVVP
jgi:hypothetical protein